MPPLFMAMNQSIPSTLQELPPKAAHLCLEIENFITNTLSISLKNTTLLVAVSGGLDSCALLLILHYLSKKNNINLHVAHLNHQLRGEAADEEQHVRDLCTSLNIPFISESKDVSRYAEDNKVGIEEAARTLRYEFLQNVRAKTQADWLVTAHHNNDLAEDVVMRLIRGSGWPALGGMDARCDQRKIIRPLLKTSKNSLESFAKSIDLAWCEDTSNQNQNFLRNRVRSTIIPILCKENPAFLDAVSSIWDIAQIDKTHWNACIEETLKSVDFDAPNLQKDDLNAMSQATRLRIYKSILDSMGQGQALQHNLLALDNAWKSNVGGKTIQFPGNKIATISKGSIYFSYR